MERAKAYTGTIACNLYEGSNKFIGVTQIKLPDVKYLTQQINGAGIGGNVTGVLQGMVDSMNITVTFTSLNADAISISTPELHKLNLREVQGAIGEGFAVQSIGANHYIEAVGLGFSGGNVQPQTAGNPTVDMAVHRWIEYRDGKKFMEICPMEFICYIDGTDYLADIRNALGQ